MADKPLFDLDAEARWRLAYDRQQWVLQRGQRAARPGNSHGIRESGWRGVSFIGSTKATLARVLGEKGVVLTAEAQARLDALSAQILPFPAPSEHDRDTAVTTHPFGGCPCCGNADGYLNGGPDHWFICHRHKTKRRAGSNLFSGWRDEDEGTRLRNRFRLSEYMTVKPVMPLRQS